MALPTVVDRQTKLEAVTVSIDGIAGLADDALKPIDRHGRDHGKTVVHLGERVEQGLRQFAHGAEKAAVARLRRERAEIALQFLRIARLNEAHGNRLTEAGAHDVRILLQIIEPKRRHRRLRESAKRICKKHLRNRRSRRPSQEAAPAWLLV